MKDYEQIEHQSYGFTEVEVLSYVTWGFKGTKEIIHK